MLWQKLSLGFKFAIVFMELYSVKEITKLRDGALD